MTMNSLAEISELIHGEITGKGDLKISELCFDSRKLITPFTSLFFAIKTNKNDGHRFIQEAFKKGVRAFVVEKGFKSSLSASFIEVENSLDALQLLAKEQRKKLNYPILAITGSNGKTIVKEWLKKVIKGSVNIGVSPRSFNSQIGVPLSIWTLSSEMDLGIIEAGISAKGEMKKLREIVNPTYGIFTTIGTAHLSNFKNHSELIKEKSALFKNCEWVVVNNDNRPLVTGLESLNIKLFKWGKSGNVDVLIEPIIKRNGTTLQVEYDNQKSVFEIPFTDNASLENACHVTATALKLDVSRDRIKKGLKTLEPIEMRLQVVNGFNNCTIINDAYTADLFALENAISLAQKYNQNRKTTLVISDFENANPSIYKKVKNLSVKRKIDRVITIGMSDTNANSIHSNIEAFDSLSEFMSNDMNVFFKDEVVIIKGARKFRLEKLAQRLQLKDHQTVLEVRLNAFTENINFYKTLISKDTKVMAMVKAFSYGNGSYEVASHLENIGVDYLGVAYSDEGIALRKKGVQLPILVLNPEPASFESMLLYNLEPEIYSTALLIDFKKVLKENSISEYPIHIKLDTGMHRLGLENHELEEFIEILNSDNSFKVKSIFSHLAASDDQTQDQFTRGQLTKFTKLAKIITDKIGYDCIKHICNTSGINRFPEAHLDMVRLGIGLYGISSNDEIQKKIHLAGKLKTTIIRTREIAARDSIGYGRKTILERGTRIAVIPIGYADGLFRALGNGKFSVKIGNQTAPIIGNICMDMAFIDITNCNAQTGQEVLVFSSPSDIKQMASIMETIPYEVLSSISQRVKREYYSE